MLAILHTLNPPKLPTSQTVGRIHRIASRTDDELPEPKPKRPYYVALPAHLSPPCNRRDEPALAAWRRQVVLWRLEQAGEPQSLHQLAGRPKPKATPPWRNTLEQLVKEGVLEHAPSRNHIGTLYGLVATPKRRSLASDAVHLALQELSGEFDTLAIMRVVKRIANITISHNALRPALDEAIERSVIVQLTRGKQPLRFRKL